MIVTKYVIITPANISSVDGVYTMTMPTAVVGFIAVILAQDHHTTSAYESGKDNRQLWALKGEEADLNSWITTNSSMVVEKTFAEADAIGKELQPARIYTVHKVITEDERIISEEDIPKDILIFELQTRLTELGI